MQIDMTVGKPGKLILTFIKPIIAGNIFQQLYSMADAVIVGYYCDIYYGSICPLYGKKILVYTKNYFIKNTKTFHI